MTTDATTRYPMSHDQAHALNRPRFYRASVAAASWDHRRLPRLTILRASCGRLLGVGYVWRRQGYIAWRKAGA